MRYGIAALLLLLVASLFNRALSFWLDPFLFPDDIDNDPFFVWYMILKWMLLF